MVDFDGIRIFLRVAERGSFTAAAQQLGLPLTTVSRKVKALEDNLGIQLVYRTTRRVSVTEAGRAYYESCARAQEILEEADRSVRALRLEPSGTLRVLMPYTLGLIAVEPRLAEFRRRHPQVQIVLTYDNNPLDLIERGLDVALRYGPLADSVYAVRHLGWSRAKLAASPAYLDRHGEPASPADLVNHELLLMGSLAPLSTLRLVDDRGDVAEVTVKPALMSNESGTLIRQAIAGEGIGLFSAQFSAALFHSGQLRPVLPQWRRARDMELTAVFPQHATLDLKVRAFVDFLVEVFADWHAAV
ncbi:LysR family transcriptional regulator [Neorhizobium sp. NCHU2750]|uniref:LysR family transcriptional regulator n=1 Tax=Neorhizobium sp. NCHU2750 TaxID=1825976 RepID=UPI000E747A4F|nr:LysR family transcriptional regulator [Neorhizobium sp. NCHU2750]